MQMRYLLCCVSLCASGCTIDSQGGSVDASFHPPIVEKHWDVKNYRLENGMQVCAISSGYNGITISISRPSGAEQVVAESTRLMKPGTEFTVTANDGRFTTSEQFFSEKTGPDLLASLQKGGKAYLEWSEIGGPSSRERVHVQNIVQLDDFSARVQECHAALR